MNLGEITLEQISAMVIQTSVLLGAVTYIHSKIAPFARMLSDNTKLTGDISLKQTKMEKVVTETILPTLEALKAEIATNGGTVSIKDKVSMHEIILNGIADGQSTAMYRCDTKGDCFWTNHSLQRMFGLSNGEMGHLQWASVIDTNEREGIVAKWLHCVSTGTPYEASFHVTNASNGARMLVKTYANPMRNSATGKIVLWVGSVVVEERE
jgi:PAS domain-containing protein